MTIKQNQINFPGFKMIDLTRHGAAATPIRHHNIFTGWSHGLSLFDFYCAFLLMASIQQMCKNRVSRTAEH
jgi:hypothetical protein